LAFVVNGHPMTPIPGDRPSLLPSRASRWPSGGHSGARRPSRARWRRNCCLEEVMAHVLLIDDDLVIIPEQVGQGLPAPAHRVTVAGDGASGLEALRIDPPEVILLDLQLPDRSGLEIYEDIRAIDARIPVVFVTNDKDPAPAIEAMKHGAVNYLHKP